MSREEMSREVMTDQTETVVIFCARSREIMSREIMGNHNETIELNLAPQPGRKC